ncbi:MAG: acetolactate synthase small subunit [Proteobacteria bacterium]|nr:acetolactate synthase small subunit [Pseudomonadota bacterium]
MTEQNYVLSIFVENRPGVLSRIVGLFSGRGYNIESLSVAETMEPDVSRLTMVTKGDAVIIEQIKKQLNKLINVIKVYDLTGTNYIQKELALIKVHAKSEGRAEILRIVDIFKGKIVDVGQEHYTIEITASKDKMTAILNLLKPMGIKEIVRTGIIALHR